MAHHAMKSAYDDLVERINRAPLGAAPQDILYEILKLLFTEKDAQLCARLPMKPFNAERAAKIWKMPLAETERILDQLASKMILLDFRSRSGKMQYVLPPPVAGFFEFSMMRVRDDIDQKLLAQLYHKYLTEEDDFMLQLFATGETQFGHMLVHEPALSEENKLHVLDHERATEIIKNARHHAVGLCYCRHKASHMGVACNVPQDICMSLNSCADSLVRHEYARRIDTQEALDILHKAWGMNLVQFGENSRHNISFICNCCSCCCDTMHALRKFGAIRSVCTNFIAQYDTSKCSGCGRCAQVCPVEAVAMTSAHDPSNSRRQKARLDEKVCLGCGVCVTACAKGAISLESRPDRVITPVNSVHRTVLMAIERGKLATMLLDNPFSTSHRAIAAILGVILKLPPIKQLMANKQLQSRYIERMCADSKMLTNDHSS